MMMARPLSHTNKQGSFVGSRQLKRFKSNKNNTGAGPLRLLAMPDSNLNLGGGDVGNYNEINDIQLQQMNLSNVSSNQNINKLLANVGSNSLSNEVLDADVIQHHFQNATIPQSTTSYHNVRSSSPASDQGRFIPHEEQIRQQQLPIKISKVRARNKASRRAVLTSTNMPLSSTIDMFKDSTGAQTLKYCETNANMKTMT